MHDPIISAYLKQNVPVSTPAPKEPLVDVENMPKLYDGKFDDPEEIKESHFVESNFILNGFTYDTSKILRQVSDSTYLEINVNELQESETNNSNTPLLICKVFDKNIVVSGHQHLKEAIESGVKTVSYKRVTQQILKNSLVVTNRLNEDGVTPDQYAIDNERHTHGMLHDLSSSKHESIGANLQFAHANFKHPLGRHLPADHDLHHLFKDSVTHDKIHKMHDMILDPSHDEIDQNYLSNKYAFTEHHVPRVTGIHTPAESILKPEHIKRAIALGFEFRGGRILKRTSDRFSLLSKHYIDQEGKITPTHGTHTVYDHPLDTSEHHIQIHKDHEILEQHVNENEEHPNLYDKDSIGSYTDESRKLNKALATKSVLGNHGSMIDNGLQHNMEHTDAVDHSFKVFSGLSGSTDIMQHMQNSNGEPVHFHTPTYLSTSLSLKTANVFARQKKSVDGGVHGIKTAETGSQIHDIIETTIPANYKHGLYVDPHSENKGEREYVLNRGHTFKVHPNPIYYAVGRKIIRHWKAEIVPKEQFEKYTPRED